MKLTITEKRSLKNKQIREDLIRLFSNSKGGFDYAFDERRSTVVFLFGIQFDDKEREKLERCLTFQAKHGLQISRESSRVFTFIF